RVLVSALEADWYAELPTGAHGLYMIAKRAFDLVFAVAVGVIAVPLMAVIAMAISVESRGPVLLRQVRVGLRGRPFVIHKFRSMRVDAEAEGQPRWASENDDRVTPVGRFLRRSRLDELPQLWDVLRGKMSIVGPRPERPEFVEQLARELPLYRARALVPPGITGWAQIQFPYAGSLEENLAKLEYDLYYIRHLGPLLDLRILLRTALTPFSGAGRRPDLPTVVTWHSDVVRQRALKPIHAALARRLLRRVSRIHVATEANIGSSAILPEFRDKIRAIPYIVDIAAMRRCPDHPL